jgi:hypothetical protein
VNEIENTLSNKLPYDMHNTCGEIFMGSTTYVTTIGVKKLSFEQHRYLHELVKILNGLQLEYVWVYKPVGLGSVEDTIQYKRNELIDFIEKGIAVGEYNPVEERDFLNELKHFYIKYKS